MLFRIIETIQLNDNVRPLKTFLCCTESMIGIAIGLIPLKDKQT